jgi:hypothetical protein
MARTTMGGQAAEEEQRHARGGGQPDGTPVQAEQDACGGGWFGHPDELVVTPGNAEVRRLHIVRGGGHMFMLEHPARMAAMVADYLKGDVGDDLEARPPN